MYLEGRNKKFRGPHAARGTRVAGACPRTSKVRYKYVLHHSDIMQKFSFAIFSIFTDFIAILLI
jgi:hypothetical protein